MKTKIFILSILCLFVSPLFSQVHVNREWLVEGGNPVNTDYVNSLVVSPSNIIHIGNINSGIEGANISVSKYDRRGVLVWQTEFNTSGSNNDYAIAVAEDNSGNIYVCGVTDNLSTSDFDVIVLKFNSSGTLLWDRLYASPFLKNDIATDIQVDSDGCVYVLVNSEGDTTMTDIVVLKYKPTGDLIWDTRYDYLQYPDFGARIEIEALNKFNVAGSSARSLNQWDFIFLRHDSSGVLNTELRDSIPGFGFNQPYAMVNAGVGQYFITGKSSSDGINYDIRTVKVDTLPSVLWSQVISGNGNSTDVGLCLVSDLSGNAIVGGYTTNAANRQEIIITKYSTSGTQLWTHRQQSKSSLGNTYTKSLALNNLNEIYALSSEKDHIGNEITFVSKFSPDGLLIWERKMDEVSIEKPNQIHVADDGSIFITSIRDTGSLAEYRLARFTEFTQDTATIYDSLGVPAYKARELIVRFKKGVLDTSVINNTRKEFSILNDFLTESAKDTFYAHLDTLNSLYIFNRINSVKIFKQLSGKIITTKTRSGQSISMPDFYNTLLIEIPIEEDLELFYNTFSSLSGIIAYVELNIIGEIYSNDPDYIEQLSLKSNDIGIYVEESWDILPSGGLPFVKCGVFDTGADWKHEDFGYDVISGSGSKINGWNFQGGYSITSSAIGDADQVYGHGTCVAGIIGAIRNNSIGIAGIAGGDAVSNNTGVSIYAMNIMTPGSFYSLPFSYIADAVVTSAIDSIGLNYAYGLHIMNHSWGISSFSSLPTWYNDTNITLLTEMVHFVNRVGVTFVAARGNSGLNDIVLPATLNDDWVLNVSGTGLGGQFKVEENIGGAFIDNLVSSYGRGVDIGAPASSIIVYTTTIDNFYKPFNGTSSSAPHVSGTVALMMSYHNDTVSAYKNLAPEDCEWILQYSAIDRGAPGYNDSTGYGQLCSGAALKLIQSPFRSIKHFGTNAMSSYSKSYNLFATDMIVSVPERFQNNYGTWFMAGNYKVDIYEINAIVNHQLGQTDTVIGYWARNSSSTPWGLPLVIGGSNLLKPYEKITIECSLEQCNLKGYVYHAKNMSGVPVGWWPQDTLVSEILFEYTLLTRDTFYIDSLVNFNISKDLSNDIFINIYPNPTNSTQTIMILNKEKELKVSISILDLSGKFIRIIKPEGYSTEGYTYVSDLGDLKSGIYFYKISVDGIDHYVKLVKN